MAIVSLEIQSAAVPETNCAAHKELKWKGEAAVTLSIGIVDMRHAEKINSIEELISYADKVMYNAKQAGRNQTKIGG